jgi:hypothetical protein
VDLSADGRYLAIFSRANDLVTDDGNGLADIFVRDRVVWTYAVDGTVRDAAGNPIPDVWVGYGSKVGQSKLTDTNGFYELYYMPPGQYTIKARKPGLLSDPFERLVSISDTTINGIDFVMRPPSGILYLPLVRR